MTEPLAQQPLSAPTGQPVGTTRLHEAFGPAMRWLLLAALVASHPVALFIPMGSGFSLVFHIGLPLFTVLAMAATAYLGVTPLRNTGGGASYRPQIVAAAVWLYAGLHGVAAVAGKTADLYRIADTAGPVLLAAFFAVAPRRLIPRRLDVVMLCLWCLQVVHCLLQHLAGYEPVGLAGNRNWAATLLAVLAPWACLALRRVGGPRRGLSAPIGRVVLQGCVIVISLVIVYACHCRATWLGLALYGVTMFLLKPCSWPGRVLVLAVLTSLLLGVVIAWPEKVGEAIEGDIRLPMYASTLRMVADHPLLGVGPGNFCRDFVLYRSRAQKARAVAAPVTEHPHCELLDVGVSVGVLGALIWAAVFFMPLVLSPGRSLPRRLAHASLWLLLVHGMLDKALIQPPTSVLAVLFAGLLWRPWLRLRADPRRRGPRAQVLRLPLAALVLLLGLHVSVREAWVGALFRQAYLAEAQGQFYESRGDGERALRAYRRAYAAYARSARIAPSNVRAHAYAGICANNKLRDPQRALEHIRAAMAIEPNFAHLNGEAGLALGTLDRHEEAFGFFMREARLFPFDVEPLQRLLLCAAATGRLDMLGPLHEQLLATSARKVSQGLGDEQTRDLALSLRRAVSRNQPREALQAAAALLEPVASQAAEPPLYGQMEAPLVDALRRLPLSELDLQYWQELERARRLWVSSRVLTPADVLALLRTAVPDGQDPDRSLPVVLTVARYAGYSPACLQWPQGTTWPLRFVELRRGPQSWLLDVERGAVIADAGLGSLLTRDDVSQACGLRGTELAGAAVLIPAHALQFLYRTQALGGVLQQTCAASAVPLAFSPMAEAARLQALLITELPRAGLKPEALPVVYDRPRLQAFADHLRSRVQPPAVPAAPAAAAP